LNLALAANSTESSVNAYLWPLFLAILSIKYIDIGGIASFALAGAVLFSLYLGRISEGISRFRTLNIGAFLTSIAWFVKYFVKTPFDALLAQSLYRVFRTTAAVPFKTIFYQKTAQKGREADEFIVYREIIMNLSKFFFLLFLAGIFCFFSQINIAFILAGFISLGLMFLGEAPHFALKDKLKKGLKKWQKS
jgi:hypothetical protein